MKKNISYILLLASFSAFSQSFQWIKRGGSNENVGTNLYESVYSIATDSERNYYTLSYVGMSDLDVDNNPKNNYDNPGYSPTDVVLASFACDGTYRWSKVFGGGGGGEILNSVVVDSQDNVYVGGTMASCDPYPGTPTDPYPSRIDSDYFFSNTNLACTRIFLAKFNNNGVLQYVNRPQPPVSIFTGAVSNTRSLGFEMHNDVIYWYLWLPPGTYADGGFINNNTTEPNTPYVLQYNLDGTFISATQLGTYQISGLSIPNVKYYRNPHNGYHYATIIKGSSSSTFSINGQAIVNSAALVCYDNNGIFLWKTENSSTAIGGVLLNDISFDSLNNIFITGGVTGLNMDSFLGLSHPLFGTGFLMKTNPTATSALWTSTPSLGGVGCYALYNNGSEIAILGGAGGGPTLTWGTQTLVIPGANQGTDVLLARINSATGACISLNKINSSTPSSDIGAAITKDLSGDYIVGGRFGGALYNVNNTATWNGGGDSDFFIAKFSTQPCLPLSSQDFEEEAIKIYPNPVHNEFTVAVKENTNYQLFTITGVLVKQGNINTTTNTIVVNELSSGCYILKLQAESGKIESVKVVKE